MAEKRPALEALVNEYLRLLRQQGIRAERAILFGSYAAGKNRPESDIDLVIVSADFEKLNLRERLELLGIASARLRHPIEALGYTPKELESCSPASFLADILQTGIPIAA